MGSLDFSAKKHCYVCGGSKTSKNFKGADNWYNKPYGKDKQICDTCYGRIVESPLYRARHKNTVAFKERQKRYDKRKLRFIGHGQQVGTFRKLTGYCSTCTKNIYDGTCKITNMHHWVYIIIFPWFGTEERCVVMSL